MEHSYNTFAELTVALINHRRTQPDSPLIIDDDPLSRTLGVRAGDTRWYIGLGAAKKDPLRALFTSPDLRQEVVDRLNQWTAP